MKFTYNYGQWFELVEISFDDSAVIFKTNNGMRKI